MQKKVITKAILVNHLNETIGLSKENVKSFSKSFLKEVCSSLKENKEVKIVNFWDF